MNSWNTQLKNKQKGNKTIRKNKPQTTTHDLQQNIAQYNSQEKKAIKQKTNKEGQYFT